MQIISATVFCLFLKAPKRLISTREFFHYFEKIRAGLDEAKQNRSLLRLEQADMTSQTLSTVNVMNWIRFFKECFLWATNSLTFLHQVYCVSFHMLNISSLISIKVCQVQLL